MVTDELQINITADTGNAAQNITNTANALNTLGDSAKTADGDMSALVRAMSEAATNMVTISQNIATSAAGLSGFQSSIDAVSSALTGINLRFDALNASIQSSYGAFDSAASSVQGLSAASEASAAGLNSIVSATDNFADRMDLLSDTTHGTTAGMVSLQKEIQDTLTTMRGFADNMGNAGKDAEDASRKIKELSEQVSALAKQSSAGNTAVMSLAAGFKSLKGIVATLGIGKFIKDSNDAYVVQMQNELKLTAHMKQRMNATDDEIKSIKELASAQQRIGVIGDEVQLAGAQQLTTYAKQASTIKTLIPAINEYLAQTAGFNATESSAISAADLFGRALNGQYTSLRHMGIMFTEAQQQILKYGTESQKAAVLSDAIYARYGKINELLRQTPTGQLDALKKEFGDLQEEIGATFQPLITAIVPVLRGVMDTLAIPIKNVSTGITIIGQAIASIDSPAVRAIGLAAAGIAVMSKLKAAIGGTSAGLLLLGVVLSGIVGAMSGQQETVGNIVEDAYAKATAATGQATGAAKEYDEQLQDVQKTASKLAGFDTITKLSGGSSGSLAANLFNEGDLDNLNSLKDAAIDVQGAFDGIEPKDITPKVDFRKFGEELFKFTQKAYNHFFTFGKDLQQLIKGWGNDEEMYQPLKNMTDSIENILNAVGLDGTGFVNFWKGVGQDIYEAMTGGDSGIMKGLKEIDDAFKYMLGDFGKGWSNFWQSAGGGLYQLIHGNEINDVEISAKYNLAEFGYLVNDKLREGLSSDEALQAAKDIYLNSSEAQYWYNNIVDPRDRLGWSDVEIRRNNLIQNGEIQNQSTSYLDVPVQRPTSQIGMPESARQYVNVYIDGNKIQPDYTEVSDGRYAKG